MVVMIAGLQSPVPCSNVEGVIKANCPDCPHTHISKHPLKGAETPLWGKVTSLTVSPRHALYLQGMMYHCCSGDAHAALRAGSPSGLWTFSGWAGSNGISTAGLVGPCTNEHLCATLSFLHAKVQPLFANSDNISIWESVGRADNCGACTWVWPWFFPSSSAIFYGTLCLM